MRLFEIPYNFDKNLIDQIKKHKKNIDFVYIPCFMEDALDARRFIPDALKTYPKTRQEYIQHIKYIQDAELPIAVLLQDTKKDLSDDILNFYINDLKIKKFIINQDIIAKRIKEINKEIYTVASITKALSLQDIIDKQDFYSEIYDGMVLFYPFNRAIKKLKYLPKKFNYTILINDHCNYDCYNYMRHWFDPTFEHDQYHCWSNTEKSINIIPEILPVFDQYMYSYKLHGRDFPTGRIVREFENFMSMPEIDLSVPENLEYYNKTYVRLPFTYTPSIDRANEEYSVDENIKAHYNAAINHKLLSLRK